MRFGAALVPLWSKGSRAGSYEMRGGVGGRELCSWASIVKWSDQEIARGSPHLDWPIHRAAHTSYATDILNRSYLWHGGHRSSRMAWPQLRESLGDGWGGQRGRYMERQRDSLWHSERHNNLTGYSGDYLARFGSIATQRCKGAVVALWDVSDTSLCDRVGFKILWNGSCLK